MNPLCTEHFLWGILGDEDEERGKRDIFAKREPAKKDSEPGRHPAKRVPTNRVCKERAKETKWLGIILEKIFKHSCFRVIRAFLWSDQTLNHKPKTLSDCWQNPSSSIVACLKPKVKTMCNMLYDATRHVSWLIFISQKSASYSSQIYWGPELHHGWLRMCFWHLCQIQNLLSSVV